VDQSGIGVATRNTVRSLQAQGVEVVSDPKGEYDLLHLQWVGPRSLHYARLAHRLGRPVALTVHTTPDLIRGAFTMSKALVAPYHRYLSWFTHHVDLVIAPSKQTAAALRQIVPEKPIHVFSGGIDLARFSFNYKSRADYRRNHNLTRPAILSAGQIIPRKGVDAFFEVAWALPDYDFLWVGPKVSPLLFYDPGFNRMLKHPPSNLHFLGFEANMEQAYCGCDILFHPSYSESLGLVILEASAVGLPLVVRRLPVYNGWLEEGVNCLMGESPEEFASAIHRLISGQESSISSSQIAQHHSLDTVGQCLINAYKAVLK
jgi:1,2-diacylglycerol-3-alpha-glucose alpha-1,2-glucosyltransferase